MSSDIPDVSVTVEESQGGIDPGDTCRGVLLGLVINEVEFQDDFGEDDSADYLEFTIRESEVGLEFTPSCPFRATAKTTLGAVFRNFGFDPMAHVDEEITLADVFSIGMGVEFEVYEGDPSSDEYETGPLLIDLTTLRPAGEDVEVSEPASSGSDGEDEEKAEVLQIVGELEGQTDKEVKKQLARQNGAMVSAFKELIAEGEIEVDDGIVLVA